jgi:hypothetical protein
MSSWSGILADCSVGAHEYAILGEPPSADDALGTIDKDKCEIRVESSLSWTKYLEVLLHEFGHIWLDRMGLEDELTERVIDIFAEGFTELGCRNPHFLEQWLGNVKRNRHGTDAKDFREDGGHPQHDDGRAPGTKC